MPSLRSKNPDVTKRYAKYETFKNDLEPSNPKIDVGIPFYLGEALVNYCISQQKSVRQAPTNSRNLSTFLVFISSHAVDDISNSIQIQKGLLHVACSKATIGMHRHYNM
jgi:hypothetical protein